MLNLAVCALIEIFRHHTHTGVALLTVPLWIWSLLNPTWGGHCSNLSAQCTYHQTAADVPLIKDHVQTER